MLLSVVLLITGYHLSKDKHEDLRHQAVTATASEDRDDSDKNAIYVDLINQEGEIMGKATLIEKKQGVSIELEAWDLSEGEHGFHIHEKGVCEAATFESAGSHFNPKDAKHGFEHPEGPHAGDLPNLVVDQSGEVKETVLAERVTLKKGEENSLLSEDGTSLVIHSDPDDYMSQPAGDSGDRIACGVIAK